MNKKKVTFYVEISSVSIKVTELTWPLGDMNFIFSCWQYLSLVRFAHSWEILSALEDKIRIPSQPCNILYLHMFCSRCRACVVFFNRHLEEHYKQSVLVVQLLHVEESYLINELITQRIVNSINILIIWKHFGNKLAGNLTLNELAQSLQVQNYSCSRLVNFGCEFGYIRGFWYFAKKKVKFRGIFRGKFAEKSADFAGFSREKSQNSRNNRPISGDFRGRKVKIRRKIGPFRGILAEKSQFSKDFQGQIIS